MHHAYPKHLQNGPQLRIKANFNQRFGNLTIIKSLVLDYIGFVKRILNLLNTHKDVRKLELEMRPARPGEAEEAYILRTRIVPKTISLEEDDKAGVGGGPTQEDQRLLQDGRGTADGGQITNGRTGM